MIELSFNDYMSKMRSKLGVFLYDREILYGWEKDYGSQTYLFKVEVRPENSNGILSEYLEFICTCDLKEYVTKREVPFRGEIHNFEKIDWMKLLQTFHPELLSRTLDRLDRKLNPNIDPNIDVNHLEVDNESNFAGNYEIGGKQACKITFGENIHTSCSHRLNISSDWQSYDLPYHLEESIEDGNDEPYYNIIHKWNRGKKKSYFESLSINDQNYIATSVLRHRLEYFENKCHYPYEIYIAGNDDESWTKRFATEDEMLQELDYLRMIEPINKNLDICLRNYHFTN